MSEPASSSSSASASATAPQAASAEADGTVQPSRKPPAALVLYNRPADGAGAIRIEPEDRRLLKQVLNWAGYQTYVVDIDDDVDRINDAVVLYKPSVVFNLVEHLFGDATQAPALAGMLDLFGYVYTGSSPGVLGDCLDWRKVQVLLEHAGLPLSIGRPNRSVHACLLGSPGDIEVLPLVENVVHEGEPTLELSRVSSAVMARIAHLSRHVWETLGFRDIGQVDFDVSPAGRVSITGVTASVDLFGEVFRTAAGARDGGMPNTLVAIARLCHARLPSEELLLHPLPE